MFTSSLYPAQDAERWPRSEQGGGGPKITKFWLEIASSSICVRAWVWGSHPLFNPPP